MNRPLSTVDYKIHRSTQGQDLFEMLWGSLGETVGLAQRLFQDGTEFVNPFVGSALAHVKDMRDDFLEGIDLEVKQNEEQLIFEGHKAGFTSPAIVPLARFLVPVVCAHIGLPRLFKRYQEGVKLIRVQAREGT